MQAILIVSSLVCQLRSRVLPVSGRSIAMKGTHLFKRTIIQSPDYLESLATILHLYFHIKISEPSLVRALLQLPFNRMKVQLHGGSIIIILIIILYDKKQFI